MDKTNLLLPLSRKAERRLALRIKIQTFKKKNKHIARDKMHVVVCM